MRFCAAAQKRKSFDSLHALARDHLELDAYAGHLVVFASRRRDRIKVMYWDRDGFAIWAKRLEEGTYAIPVADGRYKVTLKFCEAHYGRHNTGVGGLGSRVFDVYCNGIALLRNFDVYKEAGGEGQPLQRTFSDLRPTAQGKILLTFVPVKGMACVNGIEVVENSW